MANTHAEDLRVQSWAPKAGESSRAHLYLIESLPVEPMLVSCGGDPLPPAPRTGNSGLVLV